MYVGSLPVCEFLVPTDQKRGRELKKVSVVAKVRQEVAVGGGGP